MKMTPREKALGEDMYQVAIELDQLRNYMHSHLRRGNSMLPIDFYEQVFNRIGKAQYLTDIVDCFPNDQNVCPEYLIKRS